MSLIGIIVALIIVGVLLYIVGLVPMDATIKKIVYALVALAVVLWLLQALGLFNSGFNVGGPGRGR